MSLMLQDTVRCVDDRHSEQCLVSGWDYRILEIHPGTGSVRVDKDMPVFWKPERFQRSLESRHEERKRMQKEAKAA